MESYNLMFILVAAAIALAALGAAWWYSRRQRRERLRSRFGPEYDRALRQTGAPEKAAAELEKRVQRVEKFKIHPLSSEQADSFAREWKRVQAKFVDDPDGAVEEADRLVTEVMSARGYPLEDFDTRAADLSVDHPQVIENYRTARALALRRQRGEAGTEELRQAVVNYRALFDELLETGRTRDVRRAS